MRISKSNNVRRKTLDVRRWVFLHLTSHVSGLTFFLLLTAHGLLLTEVMADELHYNNILVGDRAAGMGGAYTAISDDPSGLYYNPAGIVFAPGRSFSASVNAFQYSQKKYKDVLGGNGWERRSSNLQPNYFGIIQPLGEGKIGFSYAVPDSRLEDQDQTFGGYIGCVDTACTDKATVTNYVINMNDTDYTYNFGPSYARKLNDNFSIGATLYMHYRDRELIQTEFATIDRNLSTTGDEDYLWQTAYDSLTEWGVKPLLGIMWTPADKWSAGLTISKTFIIDSEKTSQVISRNFYTDSSIPLYYVLESTDNRKLPLTITFGAAYFPSERLLISADVSYYDETSYTLEYTSKELEVSFPEKTKLERVVNAAVGAEYYLTEKVALRGGLFTNMANTPELSSGKSDQLEHIDMYGLSLSISRFTRASSLTLGGSYSMGSGEAQIISGNEAIQDADMQNFTAFISAAFSY